MIGVGISINYFQRRIFSGGTPPITYVFDEFNRANNKSRVGNAITGQPWMVQLDTWGILNNQAYLASSSAQSTAGIDSLHADDIAVQVTFSVNSHEQRLIFRYGGIANHWYVRRFGTNYELVKFVSNSPVPMGTFTTTPVGGDVIRVELVGSNIVIKVNGNIAITANDSFNQSATIHGLGSLTNNTPQWDNFSVTEL